MHFLGAVKHRQGAIDDARHFFMECLAQDAVTVRPSAAITFAILLVEDGNKVEATDWLRRGFEWCGELLLGSDDLYEIVYRRALAHFGLGHWDMALED